MAPEQPSRPVAPAPRYDAFLSYSHAVDGLLAPAVQRVLHRIGKPFLRPAKLRVFRDQSSLPASEDLWREIEYALERSRFFVLLASPEAVRSEWVHREVAFWREHRDREAFFIALTDGEIAWQGDDFDWERSTALPDCLRGWFGKVPNHVDLRWARHEDQLDERHHRFRNDIATLAAPMHGIPKDQLDTEDMRQLRLARRLRALALSTVSLLLVTTIVLGLIAHQQDQRAVRALLNGLPQRSTQELVRDPRLAAWLALAGRAGAPGTASTGALMAALDATRHVRAFVQSPEPGAVPPKVAISADGTLVAYTMADGRTVGLYDVRKRRPIRRLRRADAATMTALSMSRNGAVVAAAGTKDTVVWDVASGRRLALIPVGESGATIVPRGTGDLALSPDGRTLLADGLNGVEIWDVRSGRKVGSGGDLVPSAPVIAGFTADGSAALVVKTPDPGAGRVWRLDVRSRKWTPLNRFPGGELSYAVAGRSVIGAILTVMYRWDPQSTRARRQTLLSSGGAINRVRATPDGRVVLTVDDGGRVCTLGPDLGQRVELFQHGSTAVDADLDDVGRFIVSAGEDGSVVVLDTSRDRRLVGRLMSGTGSADRFPQSLTGAKDTVAVSPDQRMIAVADPFGLQFWRVPGGGAQPSAPVYRGDFRGDSLLPMHVDAAFSPDGSRLAVLINGSRLTLYDTRSFQKVSGVDLAVTPVTVRARSLFYLSDGRLLVADDGIRGVDPRTGRLSGPLAPMGEYAVSPDHRILAVAETDPAGWATRLTLRRADRSGLRETAATSLQKIKVGSVAVAPDGRRVAVVASDGSAQLVRPGTGGTVRLRLRGGAFTPAVAVTSDGRVLAQHDPTQLVLTDMATGTELGAWRYRVDAFPDYESPAPVVPLGGGILAAGAPDGSVALWQTDVREWVRQLCDLGVGGPDGAGRERYLGGLRVHWPCPHH